MEPSVSMSGIGVSPGVVVGLIARLSPPPSIPTSMPEVTDPEAEVDVAKVALEKVHSDLGRRSEHAEAIAVDVLAAQAAMAGDPILASNIFKLVRAGTPAPQAVKIALEDFQAQLLSIGGYLAERAADLEDIGNRVISVLLGLPMPGIPVRDEPYILVAEDLSPADTATLDSSRVLAILTEQGGPTSHTAIIAKSLGIPAIVACKGIFSLPEDTRVLVDGSSGVVIIEPTAEEIEVRVSRLARRRAALTHQSGPGRLADGSLVQLLCNVGTLADIEKAALADCEGIGLFRSEFLFLERSDAPSVDEQKEIYQRLFSSFSGRKVVVRTLDAGADKPLSFVEMGEEPNPALGIRGYRTSRLHPQLLDDQLRAISRAAIGTGADVWVMAPMVATPFEAREFTAKAHEFGLPVAGVMVEVPAAALRAQFILANADFISIGTNDLSQYTFAADRETGALPELLDPWQPAVLELVRLTAEAGRALGKPIGVCGEAASDPLLAVVFAGLGVTSLSMVSVCLAEVRAELSQRTRAQCMDAASLALSQEEGIGARTAVREYLNSCE